MTGPPKAKARRHAGSREDQVEPLIFAEQPHLVNGSVKLSEKHPQGENATKSTYTTKLDQKAPTRHCQKAPTGRRQKAPGYYNQCELVGVVDHIELLDLLSQYGQKEWASLRAYGLLLLLNWCCRQESIFSCSASLAHQYVSPIKRQKQSITIREPLPLLCHIGILRRTQKAVNCHVKTSARYEITSEFADRKRLFEVALPPKMLSKLQEDELRRAERLNRRYRFRRQLLVDLAKLAFGPEARCLLARLRKAKEGGSGLDKIVHAIDTREHEITVNEVQTIFTALSSLPRELKCHLLLDGEATVFCDVAHAHHCFLPLLLSQRLNHPGANTDGIEAERERLIEFLSHGDYYSKWCKQPDDPDERAKVKDLATKLLNMTNKQSSGIPLYWQMSNAFPKLFRIIEDIKRKDHRNLSKQLQRFTSDTINGALTELQGENIPAIPDTDAILCRKKEKECVCEVIGKNLFRVSGGVRCKVAGVRFTPQTSDNKSNNVNSFASDHGNVAHVQRLARQRNEILHDAREFENSAFEGNLDFEGIRPADNASDLTDEIPAAIKTPKWSEVLTRQRFDGVGADFVVFDDYAEKNGIERPSCPHKRLTHEIETMLGLGYAAHPNTVRIDGIERRVWTRMAPGYRTAFR